MGLFKLKHLCCLFLFTTLVVQLPGQVIDHYGAKAGIGYSKQLWEVQSDFNIKFDMQYQPGALFQVFVNKEFLRCMKFQIEAGYINKGNLHTETLNYNDGFQSFAEMEVQNRLTMHKFSTGPTVKIIIDKVKFKPYVFAGLQGEYTFYRTMSKFKVYNEYHVLYKEFYDDFKSFIISYKFGAGAFLTHKLFIEIELVPYTTNYFSTLDSWTSHDKGIALCIGWQFDTKNVKNSGCKYPKALKTQQVW